jgi:iron-sulfur cluster repair protein YtfE (RIC family)
MSEIDFEKGVADWAVDCPAAVAIFEQYGIDYCCGGKSLQYACRQAGAALEEIAKKLQAAISAGE